MTASRSSEFDLIARLFAPLTLGAAGAFGLRDDVAHVPATGSGLIITQDQVVEGRHFLTSDPLAWVGQRLVRRNLSDIVAKGAMPVAALLSLAWPHHMPDSALADFASGLGDDLRDLCGHCPLVGGDTSRIDGPMVASLTLIGQGLRPDGGPVLRSGARPGDVLAVAGPIGSAWLGTQVRLGLVDPLVAPISADLARAPLPTPLQQAAVIAAHAHASIDISDGLLADARHLAQASGVALSLALDQVPMLNEVRDWIGRDQDRLMAALTGGDDYQALIAVPAAAVPPGFHVLGAVVSGQGLILTHKGNILAPPDRLGWEH